MRLDNPFLIRELRQLERRPRGVQNSLLFCLGSMVVILVGCATLLTYTQQNQNSPFGGGTADILRAGVCLLAIFHILLCCIAAVYGAYRIFYIEDLHSTLEPLKLLPYSPGRWIWLKSVFPIFCTLVAWAAGLPFFIFAALCTLISTQDIFYWAQKPLLAGAAVLLLTLLYTPEVSGRQEETNHKTPDYSIWGLLSLSIITSTLAGITIGRGPLGGALQWFIFTIPEGLLWLVAFGAVLLAAVSTAGTTLVVSERKQITAGYLRLLALGTLYGIFLGLLWPVLNVWLRGGAFLLPLLLWFIVRVKAERFENEHNEAYVQRIAAYWDNPLLKQDLRVAGRVTRLSTLFIRTLTELIVWLLILYWGVRWLGGPGKFPPFIWAIAGGALQGLPSAWSEVSGRWQKEWSGQTMMQILITPLTDREIVLGRMAAVPLFQWVGMSPWFLACLAFTGWGLSLGFWVTGPVMLALSPLLISGGAWASAGITKRRYDKPRWGWKNIPCVLLASCQTAIFFGCFILIDAGIDPTGTFANWIPDPVTGWFWGLGLFLSDAALAWGWIQLRIWELHCFRSGDLDIPDSAIMNQATE